MILQFGIAFFEGGFHLDGLALAIAWKGRKAESSISKMSFISSILDEF